MMAEAGVFSNELRTRVANLPYALESDHFRLRYDVRNSRPPRGVGVSGRETSLLVSYLDVLERLHETITSRPFRRAPLRADNKTTVYVVDTSGVPPCYGSPFTSIDRAGDPYIVLPSRSNEPTFEGELRTAMAAVVHEGTHVFNFQLRNPYDALHSTAWDWFDEATAVFMESQILPENQDNLRFAQTWCDRPELPLNEWSMQREAGWFVRYLAKQLGLEIVDRIWTGAERSESAIGAIQRILKAEGETFSSLDPKVSRSFFSRYCMDSYFLGDPTSAGYLPDVYARFGERAITQSVGIDLGQQVTLHGSVDHLACKYYRFYPSPHSNCVEIRIRISCSGVQTPIKAEIATASREGRRQAMGVPRPSVLVTHGAVELVTTITESDPAMDHLVLCVSNSGIRAAQRNPAILHDDSREFEVVVSA